MANNPVAKDIKSPSEAGFSHQTSGARFPASPTDLATLSACFNGTLRVIFEVSSAFASAFSPDILTRR